MHLDETSANKSCWGEREDDLWNVWEFTIELKILENQIGIFTCVTGIFFLQTSFSIVNLSSKVQTLGNLWAKLWTSLLHSIHNWTIDSSPNQIKHHGLDRQLVVSSIEKRLAKNKYCYPNELKNSVISIITISIWLLFFPCLFPFFLWSTLPELTLLIVFSTFKSSTCHQRICIPSIPADTLQSFDSIRSSFIVRLWPLSWPPLEIRCTDVGFSRARNAALHFRSSFISRK